MQRFTFIDVDGKILLLSSDLARALKMLKDKGYSPQKNPHWFHMVVMGLAYYIERRLLNTPIPTFHEYKGDVEIMTKKNYVSEAKKARYRMQKFFEMGQKLQREMYNGKNKP